MSTNSQCEMRSRKSARLTRSTSIRFSKCTSSSHNKMPSQSRNSTTGSYENSHPIATSRYMSHPPKILFLRSCAGTAREMNHQRTSGMMYWEFLGSCETVWTCVICGCGRSGWRLVICWSGRSKRQSLVHEHQHHWWGAGGIVFCDPDEEGRAVA